MLTAPRRRDERSPVLVRRDEVDSGEAAPYAAVGEAVNLLAAPLRPY